MSITNVGNITITGDEPQPTPQSAYLRAVSRVDQPVSNDPSGSIIEFEVVKDQINMGIENNTDIVINKLAFYTYFITLNIGVTGGSTQTAEVWVEGFNGSIWEPVEDSGRLFEVFGRTEGKILITGSLNIPSGVKFRVHIRDVTGAGTVTLESGSLSNGVVFPSAVLNILEN